MESHKLQQHTYKTYINLRLGIGILGLCYPLLLSIGGAINGVELQGSISAYYHANEGFMRDWFVGILFTVGVCLYLYKGYSFMENLILNLAGIFAVGVAIFPMAWDCGDNCGSFFSLHGSCAILLFLCLAYICFVHAGDTLDLITNEAARKRFRKIYIGLGIGMAASPLLAYFFTVVIKLTSSKIFFIESFGIWVFGAYWLVKSYEISITRADQLALHMRVDHS